MAENKRKQTTRKLKAIKIESKELIRSCESCKYLLIAVNPPFCLRLMSRVSPNSCCPKYSKGSPISQLSPELKEKLLSRYVELEINLKLAKARFDEFKKALAEIFSDSEETESFRVVNKRYKRKLLNTKKARELIDSLPNADEYYKESESTYFRVMDKKKS